MMKSLAVRTNTHYLMITEYDNDQHSYANRSVVRAQDLDWSNALKTQSSQLPSSPCYWATFTKVSPSAASTSSGPLFTVFVAVALFNAGCHDGALQRVQELATASQHLDTTPTCSIVNMSFVSDLTSFLLSNTLLSRIYLFGWDFDSLWQTGNQKRCDAFLRADLVIQAIKSYQYMMHTIDEDVKSSYYLGWSTCE
ncbi:hypothetical protein EDB19DRAFT_1834057 [Suillus lakei]|nr:hypothetical protein EDB19DRAFT_1834057 [Suillus lakei]